MGEEATAVAPRSGSSIAERRRGEFDPGQVDLIRATVAKDLDNDAELAMFLETCVRHDFDPFIKEIWAYKRKGRVIIQVSRDGLLGVANRHTPEGKYHVKGEGMFLGCQSNVIHEHDHFDFRIEERDDETTRVVVDHSPRDKDGKPTHGGKDGSGRGEIVGSWARVRRRGHDDTFFIAYAAEYDKAEFTWKDFPHAMMQKCAESVALRKAFSIAGVVGEGELTPTRLTGSGDADDQMNWPEEEGIRSELEKAFKLLGWRRAKIRMTLNSVGIEGGDADYEALLSRLHSEFDALAEEERARREEALGNGEEITDAEVVEP
jgi:hypothetical protein